MKPSKPNMPKGGDMLKAQRMSHLAKDSGRADKVLRRFDEPKKD